MLKKIQKKENKNKNKTQQTNTLTACFVKHSIAPSTA